MKLDLQYDVLNYTPASASPVEANFNRLEQHDENKNETNDHVNDQQKHVHVAPLMFGRRQRRM